MKQIFLSIISHFTVRVANLFRKKSGQKEGGLQKAARRELSTWYVDTKRIGRAESGLTMAWRRVVVAVVFLTQFLRFLFAGFGWYLLGWVFGAVLGTGTLLLLMKIGLL